MAGAGEEKAQMVPRVLDAWIMLGALFLLETEVVLIVSLLCNKPP